MENINLENAILYADSSRGVYIPQYFAESVKRECVTGIFGDDLQTLLDGPTLDNEWYWDAWNDTINAATVTDPDTGIEYGLWQDGDLWLVPLVDLYASDLEESV